MLHQLSLEPVPNGRGDEGLMAWEVNPLVEQRGDSLCERILNDSVPNLVRESCRVLSHTNVFCQEVYQEGVYGRQRQHEFERS